MVVSRKPIDGFDVFEDFGEDLKSDLRRKLLKRGECTGWVSEDGGWDGRVGFVVVDLHASGFEGGGFCDEPSA